MTLERTGSVLATRGGGHERSLHRSRSVERDADLVCRLRSGEEAAFSQVVASLHGRLLHLACTFVASRAAAEEVVQETWLAVVEGISGFEERGSLKSWIFRILANRARTKGARERRTIPFSAIDSDQRKPLHDAAGRWITPVAPWSETPETALRSREALRLLEEALQSLPPNQRAVVLLHDVEGLDAEEVASILDVTYANQRVLLHRARSSLRKALDAHLGEARTGVL